MTDDGEGHGILAEVGLILTQWDEGACSDEQAFDRLKALVATRASRLADRRSPAEDGADELIPQSPDRRQPPR
jgi:hypothetical protein